MIKKTLPGPILVIDDDEDDHDLLKTVGDELGIGDAFKFFFRGKELLDYLKSSEDAPFLILCDINMPHINGLDLREIISKDKALSKKSIPFLFLSTSATEGQIQRAFDLTVQGFFLKGNSMDETARKLMLIIDYWLESKRPGGN